jgi:hypothetical protein
VQDHGRDRDHDRDRSHGIQRILGFGYGRPDRDKGGPAMIAFHNSVGDAAMTN